MHRYSRRSLGFLLPPHRTLPDEKPKTPRTAPLFIPAPVEANGKQWWTGKTRSIGEGRCKMLY